MKIGIVTIMDDTNYGNRLQNYAVCHFLRHEMNCDVRVLKAIPKKPFENGRYVIWAKNQVVKLLAKIPGAAEKRFGPDTVRWARFQNWNRRIPVKTIYEMKALPECLNDEYDFFFTGSDQVFNCLFPAFRESDYLLRFADNAKKAALCASFGFETIPADYRQVFRDELDKFRRISVREKAGQKIVKELIGKDVPCLIDPVMMLDEKDWLKVSDKPHVDIRRPYVLKYCLGEGGSDAVAEWAANQGYPVYELMDKTNIPLYTGGPGEFLSLIKNAALICSDSFHCIVFAILFHKPFVVYARQGEENYMTSRLDTLLEKFGMTHRWSHLLKPEQYLDCDFSETDSRLEEERRAFKAYVQDTIDHKAEVNRPALAPHSQCTGCSACAQICPKGCLEMKGDRNDFRYPEFVNADQCISCGRCTASCPVLNHENLRKGQPKAFAAMSLNSQIRADSSSGGIFSEIAEYVLSQKGIVFGAAYDEDYSVFHRSAESPEEIEGLRGAKYAESRLSDTFLAIGEELKTGRLVLFAGTPCQTAGLKSFLHKEYDNLICLDFVCHGIPSPMVWKEYIKHRAQKDNNGELPSAVNLRSKATGWSRYSYSNQFVYETCEKQIPSSESAYMNLFVNDKICRESCADCRFKGYERCSDITLGDFWGIWDIDPDMDDNAGTSVVLIQSPAGEKIFEKISRRIRFKQVTLEEAARQNPSMIRSSAAKKNRNAVLEQIRNRETAGLFDRCV